MKLFYTDRSIEDIETAFTWYQKQRTGLGFDFLDCIDTSMQNILTFPEMYPVKYNHFRGCLIRRFPFFIFYTIENDMIVIHSVFESRLDPDKRP